jgi:hypothetical protein
LHSLFAEANSVQADSFELRKELAKTEDRFLRDHPYLFLISRNASDAERQSGGFRTALIDPQAALIEMSKIERRAGGAFRKGLDDAIVLPVAKRAGGTFESRICVGRTRACDICIEDSRVSKLHAYFEHEQSRYTLVDAGSSNGTMLNGRAISRTERAEVKRGDRISFAGFLFELLTAKDLHAELSGLVRAELDEKKQQK